MRLIAPAAVFLLATACGGPEEDSGPASSNSSAAVDPGPTEPIPADGADTGGDAGGDDGDDVDGGKDRVGGGAAPSSGAPVTKEPGKPAFFDWTGRFAASRELCNGGAWNLARDRISTAGEKNCSVDETRDQGDRATLSLSCTAEGMKSKETWTLTRRGEGMSVRRDDGNEVRNVNLIRCG